MHRSQNFLVLTGCLLFANTLFAFNRQDTLRGSNGSGRSWWDVQHYELQIRLDTATRSVSGQNVMRFTIVSEPTDSMQIDLQEPMQLDSAVFSDGSHIPFTREQHVYWLRFPFSALRPATHFLTLYYHGKPREAVKPPWDGGMIWTKDSLGNPWISVACQGLGASSWWPCKDYQGDEPDSGVTMRRTKGLWQTFISNGRDHYHQSGEAMSLSSDTGRHITHDWWTVTNPINTYNVTFYAGDYALLSDTFHGRKGILNLSYYPLRHNELKAKEHFRQVKQMLRAFEYWFGPYPFYEDGYKLVEAPFLGMEHQSGIAYGNGYEMGYRGKDRSGTGVGLLFDFIIVHESGHEWFGNNITAEDIADNWIHEGFTTYSETLFTEYWYGKEKAYAYTRGEWKNIANDRPVTGTYGVQDAGSGDKYDKGSALVHTIRLLMNDDERFRSMLHKMNDTFYHKQISSATLESFMTRFSGLPLKPVFDQYLRTVMIPELEWRRKGNKLEYRFVNIVPGFTLPVSLRQGNKTKVLQVSGAWQSDKVHRSFAQDTFLPGFLIRIRKA